LCHPAKKLIGPILQLRGPAWGGTDKTELENKNNNNSNTTIHSAALQVDNYTTYRELQEI